MALLALGHLRQPVQPAAPSWVNLAQTQAVAALPLVPAEEMRSSSQSHQAVGLAVGLPAEPGTHQLLQDLAVGILAVVHQVRLPPRVSLTVVCLAALVRKVPAR